MLFVLSKVLGFFAVPSNLIVMLCMAGVALSLAGLVTLGVRITAVGVLLLLVFGLSPLPNLMLLSLSERFPAWQGQGAPPDGLIVLGGSIDPDISVARGAVELDASAERIVATLELARRYPQARIVFSGGSGALFGSEPEARVAGELFKRFGIAPERVILENKSRTTAENASVTKTMIGDGAHARWLLVTSAFHMPRSMAVFRAAGINVEAYPVDWRTRGWRDGWSLPDRLSAGLARSDVAIHEWVGLIVYRLLGRTREWLPSASA